MMKNMMHFLPRPFSKGQSPAAHKTHETGGGVVRQHGAVSAEDDVVGGDDDGMPTY